MNTNATKKLFPNPFYVLLLAASTLFVVTVFGYLISPTMRQQAGKEGSTSLADWIDRNGPLALGGEIAVMIASGLLAMATDRWFSQKIGSKSRPDA